MQREKEWRDWRKKRVWTIIQNVALIVSGIINFATGFMNGSPELDSKEPGVVKGGHGIGSQVANAIGGAIVNPIIFYNAMLGLKQSQPGYVLLRTST